MKIFYVVICILAIISNPAFGQSVNLKTEKEYFGFDEVIKLEITIDFKQDSVVMPDFDDFVVLNSSKSQSTLSLTNHLSSRISTWTYFLRPIHGGRLIIKSPVFFFQGTAYQGNELIVSIAEGSLSEQELDSLRFENYIGATKGNGTYRYTIGDEFGYIEVRSNSNWILHRRLTKEEMETIKLIE